MGSGANCTATRDPKRREKKGKKTITERGGVVQVHHQKERRHRSIELGRERNKNAKKVNTHNQQNPFGKPDGLQECQHMAAGGRAIIDLTRPASDSRATPPCPSPSLLIAHIQTPSTRSSLDTTTTPPLDGERNKKERKEITHKQVVHGTHTHTHKIKPGKPGKTQ